jgi:hypothetical protein
VLFSGLSAHTGRVIVVVLIVLSVAGYFVAAATRPQTTPAAPTITITTTTTSTTPTTPAKPAPAAAAVQASSAAPTPTTTAIDRLTAVAKQQYATEVHGGQAHATMRRVARDPALISALRSGDLTRVRAYVRQEFDRVWYHWHVSRMRIYRGTNMVIDVGVPFVVAPSQMTIKDSSGRSLGTLQVSIQDVIGFVRYMHRNYPVDVVAKGRGAAPVRTSLPAALTVQLPDSGTATVAGKRYQVRSFMQTALGNEPVKVWILQRG